MNYATKSQKDSITYKIDEKCFIIKKYQIIEHNKSKKRKFYKINSWNNKYIWLGLLFNKSYWWFLWCFKKNDIYIPKLNLLRKAEENIITKILNYKGNIGNANEQNDYKKISISEESVLNED